MANLLAGTAQITVDGNSYMLEGAAKYSPSTVTRTSLVEIGRAHV